jgi:hypothetical protein
MRRSSAASVSVGAAGGRDRAVQHQNTTQVVAATGTTGQKAWARVKALDRA